MSKENRLFMSVRLITNCFAEKYERTLQVWEISRWYLVLRELHSQFEISIDLKLHLWTQSSCQTDKQNLTKNGKIRIRGYPTYMKSIANYVKVVFQLLQKVKEDLQNILQLMIIERLSALQLVLIHWIDSFIVSFHPFLYKKIGIYSFIYLS